MSLRNGLRRSTVQAARNSRFAEAALIVESGFHKDLDRVVVCWCTPEQQIERLQERGLSPEQAQQRIAAQMPMDEKRRYADIVIDCSGTLADYGNAGWEGCSKNWHNGRMASRLCSSRSLSRVV